MTIKDLLPWKREEKRIETRRAADPFAQFHHEMNRLVESFFGEGPLTAFGDSRLTPRVDVAERDAEIVVTAELPGVDEKDLELTIQNDVLTLSGEKRAERESRDGDFYRVERNYGSFHRQIFLPAEVREEDVRATFKNGVLTVRLPRARAQQTQKRIPIQSGT